MAVASTGPYANLPLDPDITTPASHHSVFYRPDALLAAQPIASKCRPTNSLKASSKLEIMNHVMQKGYNITDCLVIAQLCFWL